MIGRWWVDPRVRTRVARIVVVVGIVLGLYGVLVGRYGFLFAGIVVIGVGASLGPARIRRAKDRER
ncbi:hypothetical protein [Agromyces marinus]|nr:hypothetical protein [Agromyces marinus]